MPKNHPLFSAIVVHYNNGDYIYETLSSILNQDYPNIELLISDDCSPMGFDVDKIIDFINEHRRENIRRVVILENERNLGTVRHLEVVRAKAQGEFELAIAADDVWHDAHVFSSFAKRFEEIGPEAKWLISQVEMCNETLTRVDGRFVSPEIIQLVQEGNYYELLNKELSACLLPGAGSVFRRSFFEKVTGLSEHYDLIEDYSTHLRALRMGIPVYYTDIVSVKHRHGGISHGNSRNGDLLYSRYVHDFLTSFELEVEPYQAQFAEAAYKRAKAKYEHNCIEYEKALKKLENETVDHITYERSLPLWRAVLVSAKNDLYELSRKERAKSNILVLFCLLLCASLFRMGDGPLPMGPVRMTFELAVAAVAAVALFQMTTNVLLRARQLYKRWKEVN